MHGVLTANDTSGNVVMQFKEPMFKRCEGQSRWKNPDEYKSYMPSKLVLELTGLCFYAKVPSMRVPPMHQYSVKFGEIEQQPTASDDGRILIESTQGDLFYVHAEMITNFSPVLKAHCEGYCFTLLLVFNDFSIICFAFRYLQ